MKERPMKKTLIAMSIIGTSMMFAQTVSAAPMENTSRWTTAVPHVCTMDMTEGDGELRTLEDEDVGAKTIFTVSDTAMDPADTTIPVTWTYAVDSPTLTLADIQVDSGGTFRDASTFSATNITKAAGSTTISANIFPVYEDGIVLAPGDHNVDITLTYICK
jgi:hypothetical protein